MIYPFSAFILMQLQEALGYFIIGCLHDAFDNDNSSKKNSVRKMLIQVFNAGSSSIKFALYQHQSKLELLKGNLEKIGEASSILSFQTSSSPSQKIELPSGCQNHKEGIQKGTMNVFYWRHRNWRRKESENRWFWWMLKKFGMIFRKRKSRTLNGWIQLRILICRIWQKYMLPGEAM